MNKNGDISPLGSPKESLSEERLLAYLEGTLPPQQQHEVEQWLAEEGMESDALEGLQQMERHARRQSIKSLNKRLTSTIRGKHKQRRKQKPDTNVAVAVAVILLLAVVCYLMLHYLL